MQIIIKKTEVQANSNNINFNYSFICVATTIKDYHN